VVAVAGKRRPSLQCLDKLDELTLGAGWLVVVVWLAFLLSMARAGDDYADGCHPQAGWMEAANQ
jgi:hypothetical protein